MLYGEALSRRALAQRTGALSQFAGVRLISLEDGVERGTRMLEFRTGSGLRLTVLVDRAFDIADFEYRGVATLPSTGKHLSLFTFHLSPFNAHLSQRSAGRRPRVVQVTGRLLNRKRAG